MKFRIHWTSQDGSEDSTIVEGQSVEEIRVKAQEEVSKRNGTEPWSEEL